MLAHHFARELGAPSAPPDALVSWRDALWPGNVRELRRAVVRRIVMDRPTDADAVASTDGDAGLGDLDRFVADAIGRDVGFSRAREELLRAFERSFVERALARHGGNVVRAASASGLARRYFQVLKSRNRKPGS